MTRRADIAIAVAAVAVVASTFAPYLAQQADPPPGHAFSGLLTSIPDQCSYLMWIDQHREGVLLPSDRMTTEPGDPFLPNPVWLVLGWLAAVTGMAPIVVYHAGRAVLALGYLWALWRVCKVYYARLEAAPWAAPLAWAFAAVGSGLAWVQAAGLPLMTADWITELWSWPSLLYYPHFAASLWLACEVLLALRPADAPRPLRAALLLALLVFVHPYTAGTLALAVGLRWLVCRWKVPAGTALARADLVALAGTAVAVGAMGLYLLANPSMATWARQNEMPSPAPWTYLAGLGLAGALGLASLVRLAVRRAWTPGTVLLAAWIGAAALLAYGSPVIPYERRCVEGVHVAFCLLGAGAVGPLLGRLPRAAAVAVAIALVAAVTPTNVLVARTEATGRNPGQVHDDWPALWEAVRALPEDGRAVFTDARTATFLAGFAGASVFAGHNELTPAFARKMRLLEAFFSPQATWAQRAATVHAAGCRWLVLDRRNADAMGPEGPPRELLRAEGRTWGLWGPMEGMSGP